MQNKYNITVGSDPEIFIENSKGEVVSAIGLVPGSKHEPHAITDKGHFIQTDNIALEYNIPPCSNEEEFIENIFFVKDYLEAIVVANGYKLSNKASALIAEEELQHPQAKAFGCSVDFNPYTQSVNEAPSANTNLRSCGAHIHLGYPNPNQETTEKIVKSFDIFVTLPSLLIDKDERRRELYGKAGAFRFCDPWGLECRQLSNFWIQSKEFTGWVYRQSIKAVEYVLDGKADELIEKYSDKVVEAINTNNKVLAQELITEIFKEEVVLV